jgi:hypothetical protein
MNPNPIRLHAQSVQRQELDYSQVQKRTSIHVNHMGIHNTNGRSRRGGRPYFSKAADIA